MILIIESSGEETGFSVLHGTVLASPSTHAVISSHALGVLSVMGREACWRDCFRSWRRNQLNPPSGGFTLHCNTLFWVDWEVGLFSYSLQQLKMLENHKLWKDLALLRLATMTVQVQENAKAYSEPRTRYRQCFSTGSTGLNPASDWNETGQETWFKS